MFYTPEINTALLPELLKLNQDNASLYHNRALTSIKALI